MRNKNEGIFLKKSKSLLSLQVFVINTILSNIICKLLDAACLLKLLKLNLLSLCVVFEKLKLKERGKQNIIGLLDDGV